MHGRPSAGHFDEPTSIPPTSSTRRRSLFERSEDVRNGRPAPMRVRRAERCLVRRLARHLRALLGCPLPRRPTARPRARWMTRPVTQRVRGASHPVTRAYPHPATTIPALMARTPSVSLGYAITMKRLIPTVTSASPQTASTKRTSGRHGRSAAARRTAAATRTSSTRNSVIATKDSMPNKRSKRRSSRRPSDFSAA